MRKSLRESGATEGYRRTKPSGGGGRPGGWERHAGPLESAARQALAQPDSRSSHSFLRPETEPEGSSCGRLWIHCRCHRWLPCPSEPSCMLATEARRGYAALGAEDARVGEGRPTRGVRFGWSDSVWNPMRSKGQNLPRILQSSVGFMFPNTTVTHRPLHIHNHFLALESCSGCHGIGQWSQSFGNGSGQCFSFYKGEPDRFCHIATIWHKF